MTRVWDIDNNPDQPITDRSGTHIWLIPNEPTIVQAINIEIYEEICDGTCNFLTYQEYADYAVHIRDIKNNYSYITLYPHKKLSQS